MTCDDCVKYRDGMCRYRGVMDVASLPVDTARRRRLCRPLGPRQTDNDNGEPLVEYFGAAMWIGRGKAVRRQGHDLVRLLGGKEMTDDRDVLMDMCCRHCEAFGDCTSEQELEEKVDALRDELPAYGGKDNGK